MDDLKEVRLSVDAAQPLTVVSPRLVVQEQDAYAIVERVLDIPNNRSNAVLEADVLATRRLAVSGMVLWQRTHGGLRFPAEVAPFPERIAEHDWLLRDNSLRLGTGVSDPWHQWDLAVTYIGYTRGANTHRIQAVTVSIGRLLRLG